MEKTLNELVNRGIYNGLNKAVQEQKGKTVVYSLIIKTEGNVIIAGTFSDWDTANNLAKEKGYYSKNNFVRIIESVVGDPNAQSVCSIN